MLIPYATDRRPPRTPWATYGIIAINFLVWGYIVALGPERFEAFVRTWGFVPSTSRGFYTIFTMMWIHAYDWMHVFLNMWFLFIFGPQVEEALGSLVYGIFYVASNVAACLLQTTMLVVAHADLTVPTIGASGAVMAVLGIFAMRFYSTRVRFLLLFFIPLRLPSAILLGARIGWEIRAGLIDVFAHHGSGGVANWAHIGGFFFGIIAGLLVGSVGEARREYAIGRPIQTDSDRARTIEELRAHLGRTPPDPEVALRLASLLDMGQEAPQEASRCYEAAIRGFSRAGQPEQAIEAYSAFARGHPFTHLAPATHMEAAACYERIGNSSAAAWVYEQVATSPTLPRGCPEIELALIKLGTLAAGPIQDPARARWALTRLLAEYPASTFGITARNLLQQLRMTE